MTAPAWDGLAVDARITVVAGRDSQRARLHLRRDARGRTSGVLEYPRGRKGPQGAAGPTRMPWHLAGTVASTAELPALAATLGPRDRGKAWGDQATGALHLWRGTSFATIAGGFFRDGHPGPPLAFTATASTLPPGSAATAALTGSGAGRTLHLGVAKGVDGPQGAQGPTDAPLQDRPDWVGPPPMHGQVLGCLSSEGFGGITLGSNPGTWNITSAEFLTGVRWRDRNTAHAVATAALAPRDRSYRLAVHGEIVLNMWDYLSPTFSITATVNGTRVAYGRAQNFPDAFAGWESHLVRIRPSFTSKLTPTSTHGVIDPGQEANVVVEVTRNHSIVDREWELLSGWLTLECWET